MCVIMCRCQEGRIHVREFSCFSEVSNQYRTYRHEKDTTYFRLVEDSHENIKNITNLLVVIH